MTKHSNREKEIMLYLQKNYDRIRVFRFDVGTAYALYTVMKALQAGISEFTKTGSFHSAISEAKKHLQIISYGVKGFPDLLAIYHGISIGIEIKVGKDKQRQEQKSMENAFFHAGGIYILLTDKEPIADQLTRLDIIRENIQLIEKIKGN
jgi:hypothetical protein